MGFGGRRPQASHITRLDSQLRVRQTVSILQCATLSRLPRTSGRGLTNSLNVDPTLASHCTLTSATPTAIIAMLPCGLLLPFRVHDVCLPKITRVSLFMTL